MNSSFLIGHFTQVGLIYPASLLSMIYTIWAIGQFFDKKKIGSYIKATLSFVLGVFIFAIAITMIAIFIDIVIKQ